jgi:hypothetical protein
MELVRCFGNVVVQDYTKIQGGVDIILTRLWPGQAGSYVLITGGRDCYPAQNIWTGLGLRACCLMGTEVKAAIMWRYNCTLAQLNFLLRYRWNILFFWRFGSWNITHVWNNGIAGVFQLLTIVNFRLTAPFGEYH